MLKLWIFAILVLQRVNVEFTVGKSLRYKFPGENSSTGEIWPWKSDHLPQSTSRSHRASRLPRKLSRHTADECSSSTSTIATFNIQNLSPKKLDKSAVANTLKRIMNRYDIIMVQEIQDKSQTVSDILLTKLNSRIRPEEQYKYVLSPVSGRTTGEKEQFATFYRPSVVEVVSDELFPDPDDYFTRDPHLVEVKYLHGNLPNLMLVNLHAKPDATSAKQTVSEISHLNHVYNYIKKSKKIENVLFMGDMNADGRYVTSRDWNQIAIRDDPDYAWLIDDEVDTTVGDSDNAYDRIVAVGPEVQEAVLADTAGVFRFDDASNRPMTQQQALAVSDHYPVEVKLQTTICN